MKRRFALSFKDLLIVNGNSLVCGLFESRRRMELQPFQRRLFLIFKTLAILRFGGLIVSVRTPIVLPSLRRLWKTDSGFR